MSEHLNSGDCPKIDIACCYRRCGAKGFKNIQEFRKHLETECQYIRTECSLCGIDSRRRDMEPGTGFHNYLNCVKQLMDRINHSKQVNEQLKSKLAKLEKGEGEAAIHRN